MAGSILYVSDEKGKKTSVLVPLTEWEAIIKERKYLKEKLEKAELSLRFKKVLTDVNLFKQGKLKTRPVKDLLDEL
ncbi:hypothetical protein H8B06_17800 [Sphingobacterium sp. DN00404]|uniref:Prevent-host-death protein n=1 Tax=Sphingobacterium micropteri TaxID=2763501 RepID=A0ABR7YTL2_9SPHI|nr:hypothetical protein [Sphingobacterium micropteri]MBD1434684.1 hypothetical protein [Sphingobacterium micropteri]